MHGTITKIHPIKYSRNGGGFIRVEFWLETKKWAKTDLVPTYANYGRWKDLLIVGANLDGLNLKARREVDADSYPRPYRKPVEGFWQLMADGTMEYVKSSPEELVEPQKLVPELVQGKLL